MSETPSWLKEEDENATIKAAVSSPVLQSTTKAVASDPAVQKATYNAAKEHLMPRNVREEEQKTDIESHMPDDEPEELDISPEELKMIEKYSLALRVAFMVISILMAAAACVKLENADIATAFIALYVFFFSVVICCFELALSTVSRWIAMNFGFLYTLSGRILFLTFVAVMCFSLGLFGKVVMGLTFAALVFNIYVLVVHPKFDRWLRHKHYKNIKR